MLSVSLVAAHPVKLECNDPRFDDGNYKMMANAIQNNQADQAISLIADTAEYAPGSKVQITVKANGDKYVKEPYGVYLALRARPLLGWKGDYGSFSNLAGNLSVPAKEWGNGNCTNTAVSTAGFPGQAGLTWTAGPDTLGDVEITLLWGNGPGTDDPLRHLFPNLTHAYLFRRTLTLKGPPIPDHPPLEATAADRKCVAPTGGYYNLPHSPVFIQKLRTFPARSVTLPAGQCLACREDQHDRCLSARVECPAEPGMLAVETLYSSADCTGSAVSATKLSVAYVHCPGPEYHSPDNLDLERFVKKLLRDHSHHFADEQSARGAIAEYRRMLRVIQKFPELPVVPSKLVDLVWHEHILDTQQYRKDSQTLFGKYIHHAPAFGDDADESVISEKKAMLEDQAEMFKKYVELFEDEPRADVWPTAKRLGSGSDARLPDCCKAQCVKPDCASCVGCNAVKCGKAKDEMLGLLRTTRQHGEHMVHVLPDHFAGYVPLPTALARRLAAVRDESYLCTLSGPLPGMNLSWTISGDTIYMKQSLVKDETWYGVGFSDEAPYDMGGADFIVTMFNKNYSGVRDLYKFDQGNNYPCFDVLGQCSHNGTVGTQDLMDRTNSRANGISSSTWSRKLLTGDFKDSPITETTKKVLFARGVDDWFTFHGKDQATACDVNFFTGDTKCGTQGVPPSSSGLGAPTFV